MRRAMIFLRAVMAPAASIACALVLAGSAGAQSGPLWFPLDAAPPGTPTDVIFDVANSSPSVSKVELVIHGFWRTDRVGPDLLSYQEIRVPGLPAITEVGAPELPVYRFDLGIVTDAMGATFTDAQVLSHATFPGMRPWPHVLPAPPDTTMGEDVFVADPLLYTSPADFPPGPALPVAPASRFAGTLRAASTEVHPFHWNASGNLEIDAHIVYTFVHAGSPVPAETATGHAKQGAVARLLNGPTIDPWIVFDPTTYIGEFLFIYPAAFETKLYPLIWQKKTRGYHVTTAQTGLIGTTCAQFRTFIENWYAATPIRGDHYCILVGDVDVIPMCQTSWMPPPVGGPINTDDRYADADGDGTNDLWEEVYVGRLAADNPIDLEGQVARILAYEDTPSHLQLFNEATLVAWRDSVAGSDDQFEQTQHKVTLAGPSYGHPLSTTEVFGSSTSSDNHDIKDAAGRAGILCYEGHGSQYSWWQWNQLHQSFSYYDALVANTAPVFPVVWSLACLTGDLNETDCFAEFWMNHGANGASAVYAGTRETYIAGNKVLNAELFHALFDLNITTHAKAIEWAEAECTKVDNVFNEWTYLLLGDPEMEIRRQIVPAATPPWVVVHPPLIIPGCSSPGCCPECSAPTFDVTVRNADGQPVPNVLVALYKQGVAVDPEPARAARSTPAGATQAASAVDEVLVNRYTGPDGRAVFALPPLSPGKLYVTMRDFEANTMRDSVPVADPAAVPGPLAEESLRLSAIPSVTGGATRLSFSAALPADAIVALFDVRGRCVRRLQAARGERDIAWDGRDQAGRPVGTGLYFARLSGAREAGSARIGVLR